MSIIGDLKQLESAIFDDYIEIRRTSVDSILYQFFQRMDWRNDDLPSGNLIHDVLVKRLGNVKWPS